MNTRITTAALLALSLSGLGMAAIPLAADPAAPAATTAKATEGDVIARGRYLVRTSGCNDCHTPQYPERGGNIPEHLWLTGSAVGFQGPWGTTYPVNLRLAVQGLDEQEWIARARSPMRPPMPWFNLRDMNDGDLVAIYRYLRQLGPEGLPAPAYVPPGQPVATPYIDFVPRNLPAQAQLSVH